MIERLVVEEGPSEVTLQFYLFPHQYLESPFFCDDLQLCLLHQVPEILKQLDAEIEDFEYAKPFMDRHYYPAWVSRIDLTKFKTSAEGLVNGENK